MELMSSSQAPSRLVSFAVEDGLTEVFFFFLPFWPWVSSLACHYGLF